MISLRQDQRTIVDKAKEILNKYRVVYLAAEVRTGKNFMSFSIAKEMGYKLICFITKKKALIGVNSDYKKFGPVFTAMTVVNFEQAHKLSDDYDCYIVDEAHSCGQLGKPSLRAKKLKALVGAKPLILMSGTPTPESPSQIYHQFWITKNSPFKQFVNFYKWAAEFVIVKKKVINGFKINDYTNGKEAEIKMVTDRYTVTLSQEEAGFTSFVDEEIIHVPIDERMYRLMSVLKRDKIYTTKAGDIILADTPVKMQSVFHQLSSGTIKIDDTKRVVLDESKAWFIKTKFAGQKIAIFYKFIAEGDLLRKIFPDHTDNPDEFNRSLYTTFICQVVSGREGVNLSTADCLVMYNIDFSATSYWQARARMQSQDRTKSSKLYWIFSEKGLEHFVYAAVSHKKNFTLQYFKKAVKDVGQLIMV
jgi:hypothetical protein